MTDRIARISYSKDGGRTWSKPAERSLGEVGDFVRRVTVNRLGEGRQWVFDIATSSPVKADLLSMSIQTEPRGP